MSATTADSLTDVPTFGPATAPERIAALDILRGVAVFGIILSDIDSVFRTMTTSDRAATFLYSFFVWDRFWPLFSFLFGLGFVIQMLRAESRGAPFVSTYWRRLFVLFLFGAANVILLSQIWRGDFLHRYAVLGLVLVLFRRWSSNAILIAALVFFLMPTAREIVTARNLSPQQVGGQQTQAQTPPPAAQVARRAEVRRLQSEGTYAEVMVFAAQRFVQGLGRWNSYLGWLEKTFPLFLLGLYIGRRRMWEDVGRHVSFIRKALWWALAFGVVGGLWGTFASYGATATTSGPSGLLGGVLERLAGPALSLFYASGIVLLLQRAGWRVWLAPFAAVGRTALSNYLFQAAALAVICSGYGLGLSGKLSPLAGAGLACVIFVIELVLSNWWMQRFRSGPAEWLWRSATYWSRQPMRAQQTTSPAVST